MRLQSIPLAEQGFSVYAIDTDDALRSARPELSGPSA
jgi:hypothetical protein